MIAGAGAAFALLFDIMSLTTLFSVTASKLASVAFSIGVHLLFVPGMMVTDGVNGFWVAWRLRKTNRRADRLARNGLVDCVPQPGDCGLGRGQFFPRR